MPEPTTEPIGKSWMIAIVALLAALLIGIVLYLRMGAPLREQPKRTSARSSVSHNLRNTLAMAGRDWV